MTPVKLNIYNFLSHEKSEIDFSKFNCALILGSYDGELDRSNGAGKSALLDAVMWALFGKSRHKKKDGVVKKDKRSCRVEFIFDVEGQLYKITRRRDKQVGEEDVVLEQMENGNYKNISCDTNSATNDKIEEIVNINYEVFINSVYFKQNDVSMFAEATQGKRKDVLKALLKMDIWDQYQKKAKDMATTLSVKIEEKTNNLINDNIQEKIKTLNEQISKIQSDLANYNLSHKELSEGLINKTSQRQTLLNSLAVGPDALRKIQREHQEAKKRVSFINSKVEENKKTIEIENNVILDVQQKIKVLNEKIKLKKDINLSELNSKLVAGKTKEKVIKERISHIEKDILSGDVCPVCDKRLTKDDLKAIGERREEELTQLKNTYTEIQAKLVRAEAKSKELAEILEEGNKAELYKSKADLKLAKSKLLLDQCVAENENLIKELPKLQDRNFEKEINELKTSINKDELDKLEVEISSTSTKLENIRNMCANLNMELGSKNKTIDELQKLQQEQSILAKEINDLNEDFTIYDKLKQYFGKDGIQAVIIENVIEELETYTNETLAKICNEPTNISILTQKQSEGGSWIETFDIEVSINGRDDDFEALSGGEQFRISLALRLALSKILSKRMGGTIKFLLLDEVSSSLDDKGLIMFIDIVRQLGNDMKVLVISHDDKIKQHFSDIIMINKTAEGSRIL